VPQQVRLQLLEHVVGRDDGPDRLLGKVLERIVDNAELGAELARRARRINGSEGVLPEAEADGQERIVIDQEVAVLRPGTDRGAGELTLDLAGL
jgi:hypothetical protein